MRIVSVASGSRGNAYVVEQGNDALLIDCGISAKRLAAAVDLSRIRAVLITHDHSDHVSELVPLLNRIDVPVYANLMTAEVVVAQEGVDERAFACFENGQSFEVGPFAIAPFSIPHDAADPVGYLIRGDETYFHGTDIGSPLDLIGLKLAAADAATLESNHDPVMLRTSRRPPCLVQRIAGPRGHLANDQACNLVKRFAAPQLRRLALAHLSRECNTPLVAELEMRATLRELGREDITLRVFDQDRVIELD